jgi:tetratricopeptide (TPR) repeat protein
VKRTIAGAGCVLALASSVPVRPQQECADPAVRAAAEKVMYLARTGEISGIADALLSWDGISSAPEAVRARIRTRIEEQSLARWNSPEHLKSMVTFYCQHLGDRDAPPEKVKEVMKEASKLEQTFEEEWIAEILHQVQDEFAELQRPDGLLKFGDFYARAERWDFAGPSFKKLLAVQTDDPVALEWMGATLFHQSNGEPAQMQEALVHFRKLTRVLPNMPEGHYWIGTIAWTLAFNDLAGLVREYEKKAAARVSDDQPLPSAIRAPFASRQSALIEEGIQNLEQVLNLSPDFVEADFYLSYLYRLKGWESADDSQRGQYFARADKILDAMLKRPLQKPRALRPILPPPPPPPPA